MFGGPGGLRAPCPRFMRAARARRPPGALRKSDPLLFVGAAMAAAGMAVAMAIMVRPVGMVVMVAPGLGVIGQLLGQQIRYRLVRVPLHAAVQVDPRQGKGLLGAAADAPANQGVHLVFL